MPDYGARYADKKISDVQRELKRTYRTAQKELKKKLADFNRRHERKCREKKQQLEEGKISKSDYQNWLTGQVFIRNQWESNIRQVNAVMLDCNRQSMRLINESKLDVFAENYNFNAFKAEREMVGSFNVYSAEAVARLILDDPKILPEWKIDEKKDYDWNYQKVSNIVKQGIIQGEGVDQITQRLCTDLCTMNENKMRMFARTALTGAQNAGRQQQMNDAADMGLEVNKQWLATHDSHTRDSHRELDGEEVPYNEEFSNGLEYPGDPDGEPEEVYNCRCTMVTIYPKYEDRSKHDWREDVEIDGMDYEEWKEGKLADNKAEGISDIDYFGDEAAERKLQERPMLEYLDDEVMSEYNKLEKAETYAESATNCNPLYGTNPAYEENCTCCALANEARIRGYDVIAGIADERFKERTFYKDGTLMKGNGSWTDCFSGIVREKIGTNRKEYIYDRIEKMMKGYGHGSRAFVRIELDRGGGHILTALNIDGVVAIENAQHYTGDVRYVLDLCKPTKTEIYRVDNCRFTKHVERAFQK